MPITPGGRFSPGDSDDWDLTTDLAAMQVSNESATATAIAAIPAQPQNYRIGTNAQRLALTGAALFEGLKFYATDTNRDWFYDGATWLPADPGTYLLRPSSVTGGTIATDGTVNLSSSNTVLQVNGVFSTRFRRYEVRGNITVPSNSYMAFQLSLNGSAVSSSTYAYQDIILNGTGAPASFNSTGTNFPIGRNLGAEHYVHVEVMNPGHPARTMISGDTSTYIAGKTMGGGYLPNTTAYDGFALSAPGTTAISGGNIAIYGLV